MSTKAVPLTPPRRCPVSHHTTDQEDLVPRDFTTQGKPSNLDCPFAKFAAQNGLPDTPESHDPIAAEFHQDVVSVNASTAATGPLGRCPIRFLDKHSPEEITSYFENHKHELPRSHQVCVQRYQRNEAGAKQLDARYGSLTNMIQGLGRSHKPYLPEGEKAVNQDTTSSSAVEKWAESVSRPDSAAPKAEVAVEDEQRQSHFERPLREIRVGESPSRPWGISVPVAKEIPASALASEANQPEVPDISTPPAPVIQDRAPQATKQQASTVPPATKSQPQVQSATSQDSTSAKSTQVIFNGPVFFGYTPEDAAAFLKLLSTQTPDAGNT
jgi:hypothetical protein